MSRCLSACILTFAFLAAGCGASPTHSLPQGPGYGATAQAKPKPRPPVTGPVSSSWAGDWVAGDGTDAAPAGGVAACMSHFHIAQDGAQFILDADHNPDAGDMPTYLQFEHATGTLQNGTLTLVGDVQFSPTGPNLGMPAPEKLTYVLTQDASKSHLVGTRNGQPFWAAPFKAADAATCAGQP